MQALYLEWFGTQYALFPGGGPDFTLQSSISKLSEESQLSLQISF